jgi:hypothetical protein
LTVEQHLLRGTLERQQQAFGTFRPERTQQTPQTGRPMRKDFVRSPKSGRASHAPLPQRFHALSEPTVDISTANMSPLELPVVDLGQGSLPLLSTIDWPALLRAG